MRQELRDTYITHPCSSGKETEVAATRIHTQVPQSCRGQTQAPLMSMGWGKPLLLPKSLLTSLLGRPQQPWEALRLWAARTSLPEHPGKTAALQAGTRFPESSWEILQKVSYKRERFAAMFDARKHLTPGTLEKPENVLLSGKGERPHRPSPARLLISWA